MNCSNPNESICANCILKFHSTHELQSYQDYKKNLDDIEKIQQDLETQALALYQKFREEMAVKFQFSVFEVIKGCGWTIYLI